MTDSLLGAYDWTRRAVKTHIRLSYRAAPRLAHLHVSRAYGAGIAQPASPTRAGLSGVLLMYFLGVILVITLAPFRFHIPDTYALRYTGKPLDVVANVLLFLPLGFLYPLTRPARDEPTPFRVLLLGLILSGGIETIQLFEHDRVASLIDVLTNGSGALLGALAVRATTRRVRVSARHVGRLSLEIPLIGLIYLLVPLALVVSYQASTEPIYLFALVPIVFAGARLMSAVQRNHFAPSGLLHGREIAIAAAIWVVIGTFSTLR